MKTKREIIKLAKKYDVAISTYEITRGKDNYIYLFENAFSLYKTAVLDNDDIKYLIKWAINKSKLDYLMLDLDGLRFWIESNILSVSDFLKLVRQTMLENSTKLEI